MKGVIVLRKKNKVKWVLFKDKLPKSGQEVLISDGKIVAAAKIIIDKEDIFYLGCDFSGWKWFFTKDDITHWALLPEPPEIA